MGKSALLIAATLAAALAAVVIGGALFIGSGSYNIGADDHHTKWVLAMIERLRERSIEVRARSIEVPDTLDDPQAIALGAQRYAALCAGCHLAPGAMKSEIRSGLYPHPPNLAEEEVQPARRAFWIVKHGIKMSAMPAWSKTLDDASIWNVVAFIRKMPAMTPDVYAQLSRRAASPPGAAEQSR
jgi:mono/diheme cytochrome c family protein